MNVITVGTFDLFHFGHVKLLKKCRQIAGEDGQVIVGLNTDEFIEAYKKKKPIMSYLERSKSLNMTGLVDDIRPNAQMDGTIKEILRGVHVIVIGSDWARKDYLAQVGLDWDWIDRAGISLCYVPYSWEISSTEIKRRIDSAKI